MARTNWNRHFFSSTRGQIIILLRRNSHTVEELAQALALTHTAVRAHTWRPLNGMGWSSTTVSVVPVDWTAMNLYLVEET